MKSFIALFALVAVVVADVSHLQYQHAHSSGAERDAVVVRSESDVLPDGYNYVFETSNGIAGQASAVVKPVGNEQALEVQGSNHHTGPDGIVYEINYIANENGYQPQGAHLPTPPPTQAIPDYIQKSILYNEQHQEKSPAQYNRFQ